MSEWRTRADGRRYLIRIDDVKFTKSEQAIIQQVLDDTEKEFGQYSPATVKGIKDEVISDAYHLKKDLGVRITLRRLRTGKIGRIGRPVQ